MAVSNYYRSDGWVKTTLGPAVPGAQVYVCTQPANVFPPATPPRTTPVPWTGPNPLASIYSDDGITPIVQPIITDGFGHYDFYALPGLYTVVIVNGGTVQQYYVDQSLGNVGTSSGTSLLLSTNGTPNFNQLVQNLVQGAGIIITTDNFGNTTITGGGGSATSIQGVAVTSTPPSSGQSLVATSSTTAIWETVSGGSGIPLLTTARSANWQSGSVAGFFPFIPVNDGASTFAGSGSLVTTGTVNAPTATEGMSITFVNASTSGNQGVQAIGCNWVSPLRSIIFDTTVKLTVGSQLFYVGLSSINFETNANLGSFIDPTTVDSIVIGNNGSGSTYQLITSSAGTKTVTSTGVSIDGNRHKVQITMSPGTVSCTIDGNLVATNTTNLPTSALGFVWYLPNGSGTLNSDWEYAYIQNTTP